METVNHFISNDDTSHKYGVLGLGNLGKKIAENLSNSGRCVLVYDTINRLPLPGTITTESANQLISQAKIIFSCISDPINVKNVSLGLSCCILSNLLLHCRFFLKILLLLQTR